MSLRHFAAVFLVTVQLVAQKVSFTPETIYSKSKASVVTILTFDTNRAPLAQGSGFIIGKNKVVTNYHVVSGSASASIVFDDGSMAIATAVVSGSEPKDLVILEAETGNRPALGLGDDLQLKVGENIYAIGAPKGLSASLSAGLVSGFREDGGQFLIQITASISSGSSGGPLLNRQAQVVGVTTSRLKDGSFGFAVGAGDLKQLVKAPLPVKAQLSDLMPKETTSGSENDPSTGELKAAEELYDQKKYDDALASLNTLDNTAKSTFAGQFLLCKIQEERKQYQLSIDACNAAIQLKPDTGDPYEFKALSLLMLGNTDEAEASASRAVKFSGTADYKNLLGVIHYVEEKYELVPNELQATSNDTFAITLLAGAAFHNRDWDSFRQLRDKLTTLKGDNNGWTLYLAGVAAERELNWDVALDKYKKCDTDSDFIDPTCQVAAVRTQIRQLNYSGANSDIENAILHHPNSHDVLSEGVFVNLLIGNAAEADHLHELLKTTAKSQDDFTDCLYYYGRNLPLLAKSHCEGAIHENENDYTAWSNAGYVELDIGDFQSALSHFAKAIRIFYASKEKHTGAEELDVSWGLITAEYYSGDRKGAKSLYRAIKKDYPGFLTTSALKQLPLVWSNGTVKLIDRLTTDFR